MVTEAKPGDEVTVRVQSDAGSVVGLLSVDKSVLLLGSGNDITQSQVCVNIFLKTCGKTDIEINIGTIALVDILVLWLNLCNSGNIYDLVQQKDCS